MANRSLAVPPISIPGIPAIPEGEALDDPCAKAGIMVISRPASKHHEGTRQNILSAGCPISEVEPQRELSRPIASVALGQCGLQDPEGRGVADVQCGRRKIGVVENICEGSLEAEMEPFPEVEALGETGVDIDHAG